MLDAVHALELHMYSPFLLQAHRIDLSLQRRMRLQGTAALASTASLTQTTALPKQCPVSGSSQCLRYDFVYAYLWSVTIRIVHVVYRTRVHFQALL